MKKFIIIFYLILMYYCIAQKESKLKIYFNFISDLENTNKNNNIIIYL